MVQWLTLHALKTGVWVWSLVGELRSHVLLLLESSAELKKILTPGPTLKGSDFNGESTGWWLYKLSRGLKCATKVQNHECKGFLNAVVLTPLAWDRGFFFLSSCFKIRFIIILIHNNNFFGVQMLISEKSICTETQESSNAVKLIIQMVIENENLWFWKAKCMSPRNMSVFSLLSNIRWCNIMAENPLLAFANCNQPLSNSWCIFTCN